MALTFLLANLIVAVTAVRLATVAPLRGVLDRALAAAVGATTQIVVSLLIAGALLQALAPGTVLLTNAVLGGAVFGLTANRQSRVSRASLRYAVLAGWRAISSQRWVAFLVVTAALALLWRLVIAYALPPYGWDTLAYHLPTVAGWLQYGRIGAHQLQVFSASYPANMELLFTWVAVFLHSDVWVGAVQIPLAVVGAAAVAGMACLAGIGAPMAIAAGALFVLSPIVLTQSSSNYVDLGVAALFLAGIYFILRAFPSAAWGADADRKPAPTATRWSRAYLVFAGCAVGLAAGAKPTGPLFGLVSLLCLLTGMVVTRRRLDAAPVRPLLSVLLLLAPMLCLSLFWYVRDLILFSNPFYPANVSVLGTTLFHGPGVALSRLPTGSGLTAPLRSWGHDLLRLFHPGYTQYNRADEFEGGLGPLWTVLGLPLLIPFVIAAWKRNQLLFWSFLVPVAVLFTIQPYKWWSRFTIFLLAPALVGIAHFIDRPGQKRLTTAVQALVLACVVSSLWLSSSHVAGWGHLYNAGKIVTIAARPTSQRTVGRLFLPEFRWVDDIARTAHIAAYLPFNSARDLPPRYYGLNGRHFQHTVVGLPNGTQAATMKWLAKHSIGYVYVKRPSPQDQWLRRERRFRLLFASAQVAAYATPQRDG